MGPGPRGSPGMAEDQRQPGSCPVSLCPATPLGQVVSELVLWPQAGLSTVSGQRPHSSPPHANTRVCTRTVPPCRAKRTGHPESWPAQDALFHHGHTTPRAGSTGRGLLRCGPWGREEGPSCRAAGMEQGCRGEEDFQVQGKPQKAGPAWTTTCRAVPSGPRAEPQPHAEM